MGYGFEIYSIYRKNRKCRKGIPVSFLLFLSSIYNLFKFASLENEEVEVSDMVLPSKTSGDVEYIEQDDLSANCKFLIDRTTHWLG
mgnify:FL=1